MYSQNALIHLTRMSQSDHLVSKSMVTSEWTLRTIEYSNFIPHIIQIHIHFTLFSYIK